MNRKLIGVLALFGLLAVIAAPAMAQEQGKEWIWTFDGKHYFRTEGYVTPTEMPKTYLKEVPAGENKEGDVQGFKYLGKRTEIVYFRETPFAEAAKGHECSWRMVYEKKYMNKYHFCLVNGAEQPCPGMTEAGECLGKK
ncbi:MAG: hypothetical protein HY293_04295 [Planctomycetes bacterium]|nr:hypothetical protein [Planctomycetota bacterium]